MKIELEKTETKALSKLLMVVIIGVILMVVAIQYKDKVGIVHYSKETKKEFNIKMK